MTKLLHHEKVKPLLSDEHFSVDGTLIEAWASHKSFKPKRAKNDDDGSNFHGQVRKNDTHQSTTDPQARLYRKAKGREAKLSYLGHAQKDGKRFADSAGWGWAEFSSMTRRPIRLDLAMSRTCHHRDMMPSAGSLATR
jgi:hypothetical protein